MKKREIRIREERPSFVCFEQREGRKKRRMRRKGRERREGKREERREVRGGQAGIRKMVNEG